MRMHARSLRRKAPDAIPQLLFFIPILHERHFSYVCVERAARAALNLARVIRGWRQFEPANGIRWYSASSLGRWYSGFGHVVGTFTVVVVCTVRTAACEAAN
jgi:hypothetical protein